jgi:L-aminopeptidase/D-esterase-like protein
MAKRYADRETKTLDVDIEQGEPIVKETWLFECPDGQTDYLQRRHPVTDPHERAAIMAEAVETVDIPVAGVTIRGLR